MSWHLFDRIRSLARSANIYQQERLFQDQSSLARIMSGNELLNFSQQQALLDQTNLQINRLERYKDYDQMDETGEMSLALDLYADEGCLAGHTKIPLLDGTYPTIAELADKGPKHEFWVYSFDLRTGEYVPAKASGARISGRNVKTIKVILDGSEIICTPDHLFMLNNGTYVEAQSLKPGDSLKPLYKLRRYRGRSDTYLFEKPPYPTASAYDFVYNGDHLEAVHRVVSNHFDSTECDVVHHKDFNGLNNTPTNLKRMSYRMHYALHAKTGKDNPSYRDLSIIDLERAMCDLAISKRHDLKRALRVGDRVIDRVLLEHGLDWATFRDNFRVCECGEPLSGIRRRCEQCQKTYQQECRRKYHQDHKNDPAYRNRRLRAKRDSYRPVLNRECAYCGRYLLASKFMKNNCAYSPYCNECRPIACQNRYLNRSFANHKVIAVEDAGYVDEVYDIEVPGYHCFAAGDNDSWVIVHNSLTDPEQRHVITIKAESKVVKETLEELFFDQLLIDSQARPMVRYLAKYGDAPFEIVPTMNRDGVAALRFINVYNFTRVETKHGDLVGFFHQDEVVDEPEFLHPWQVMHLRLTDYGNTYHPYGRCSRWDGPIWTTTGWKRMKDISCGDEVFAWDGEKAVPTKVVKSISNGIKKTIKIKTKHRCIEVTPEHPVLAVVKDNYINTKFGSKRDIATQRYVLAGDLKQGDKLVLPKPSIGGSQIPIDKHDIGAYAGKHLAIPDYVDEDFARLVGFAIGDGWIPKRSPQQLCIAEGEHADINQKYINIIANYGYDGEPVRVVSNGHRYGQFQWNAAELARTMTDMGLEGRAWEKRVPGWVYRATDQIKEAFVEGLVDADGSTNVDKWGCKQYQLEVSSKDLCEGVKVLLDQMGYKCGNVSKRTRLENPVFDGIEYERRPSYVVYWYNSKLPSGNLMHMGRRCTKYDNSSNEFLVESIISIEEGDEIEVGDIQVESEHHNFIANGVVVHNSIMEGGRKAFKQLRLMEDAALIYRICLRGDSRVWTPDGYKQIRDLHIGDEVYCYDKNGEPKKTKVIKYYCNGQDRILRVASRHREIFCNPSHPILVEWDEHGTQIQAYVDARDLVPKKHRLLLPKIKSSEEPAKLEKPRLPRYMRLAAPIEAPYSDSYIGIKAGLKASTIKSFLAGKHDLVEGRAEFILRFIGIDPEANKQLYLMIDGWKYVNQTGTAVAYSLPDVANEDFARWFGFMLGDGFVSQREGGGGSVVSEVGFAVGSDEECNDKYKQLFEQLVGSVELSGSDGSRLGRYSAYSVYLAEFMKLNGFVPGAHNKRIPAWVYKSSKSVQEAFIDGYADADGCRRIFKGGVTESCEVECCNKELLEDLKELLHQLGWTAGNIRHRKRGNDHIIDGATGRVMGPTDSWCLYFTKKLAPSSERVFAIEEVGCDEVYDITVEDELHNIIVNGVAVSQTRAPEKRIFKIPIGNIPAKDVPEFMQGIARIFKNQRFYDPRTGQFNERFSPLIQEDDFFLPVRPDGTSPSIDTLPGAQNLDQIADIEYFKKKMVAPTKIPFKRVGIGEGAGEEQEKSLSASDAQFSKAVQWIQREVSIGFTKIAICHLAMAGFSIEDLKSFEISMSASSAIEELYRIETWQGRTAVMSDLKDLGWFPEEWIVTRFTDLSPDEIQEIQEIMAARADVLEDEDEMGLGGSPGRMGRLGDLEGREEALPDVLGGEAGEAEGLEGEAGMEGMGGAGGVGGAGGAGLEGLDRDFRRVVSRMRKYDRKQLLAEYVDRIAQSKCSTVFGYLSSSNELDGLESHKRVLVESMLPPGQRETARAEYLALLQE